MNPHQHQRMIRRFGLRSRDAAKGTFEHKLATTVVLALGYFASVRTINGLTHQLRAREDLARMLESLYTPPAWIQGRRASRENYTLRLTPEDRELIIHSLVGTRST